MKIPGWHGGGLSHKILYALVAVTLVVFALFFTVGYDHPFAEDPDFIEPRLTAVVIILAAAVCLTALCVTAWAVVMHWRKREDGQKIAHGINGTAIAAAVVAFTVLLLLISFAAGSTEVISVNGKEYTESMPLRGSGMFVISSVVMIVAAAAAVAWGTLKSHLNK